MRIPYFLAFFTLMSLASCGGGRDDYVETTTPAAAATPARVEIAPDTVVLTAPLQEKRLAATVYDAEGKKISATVVWSSSRPAEVSVDASGKLVATGRGGSAQIFASVGAVKSAPLLAVHTQVPANAVLLTDAQITGQPQETTPGAEAAFTNTYSVNLVGIPAPRVGDLVINTESKVVAGRVRAVSTTNGTHAVTLGLVPAREMFPNLSIDEAIDMSGAEVTVPPEIAAMYEMKRDGDTFVFTPKPGQIRLGAQTSKESKLATSGREVALNGNAPTSLVSQDFKLGPFACKAVFDGAAGTGSEVMALTLPPLFTVALNPRLDVVSTPAHGLERFVFHSEPSVSMEVGVKALIAAELKVSCEAEVLAIKIPVGGPLSLIVGGVLPVGVGAELGGKFTFVNLGISAKATAKTTGDLGVSCPAGANCSTVAEFGKLDVGVVPGIDMPTTSDLRIEPSLSTYAFVKASIGNPFLKSLRFDAFKIKAGAAFKGNFSTQGTQISDTSYQSDYKLVSEIKAGADTGFVGFAAFFGLNSFAETLLELSSDVGSTPVGSIAADTQALLPGQKTTFTVTLDPKKTDFIPLIGPYNVARVLLVRRSGEAFPQTVGSVTAEAGQTVFKFELEPSAPGRIDEYHAFVVTKLLPTDNLSLELGRATAPTQARPAALALGAFHTCLLTHSGGVKCWGRNTSGQLGNGQLTDSAVPVDVVGLDAGVAAIASGGSQSCALTANGAVLCWGSGALGSGLPQSSVPVGVRGLSLGAKAISVGTDFACAVTAASTVMCWGANTVAQLGNGDANSGTLGFSTPNEFEEFPVNVTGPLSDVVALSSGLNFSCALSSAGTVKCWGFGGFGTYGSGSVVRSYMPVQVVNQGAVLALAAASGHVCALTATGGVNCWGGNSAGQLGNGPSAATCAGPFVLCSASPVPVSGLDTGVLSISAGSDRTCAILQGGATRCWGRDAAGNSFTRLPSAVVGLSQPQVAVSAGGGEHLCAISEAGAVQCWGDNGFGQLGNGTTASSASPVNVRGFP